MMSALQVLSIKFQGGQSGTVDRNFIIRKIRKSFLLQKKVSKF